MTDFVRDNTTLANGKVDDPARPVAGPLNRYVKSAEWNAAVQAAYDLRTAAKVQQVHVLDFGAVGDGSTDDYAALQAAINSAQSAKKPLVFEPRKTYLISKELSLKDTDGPVFRIFGHGASLVCAPSPTTRLEMACNGSTTVFNVELPFASAGALTVNKVLISSGAATLLALGTDYTVTPPGFDNAQGLVTLGSAPSALYKLRVDWSGQRSCLAVEGLPLWVTDLSFLAQRTASYGSYIHDASTSRFEDCLFYQGLVDGLHQSYNCDRLTFLRCRFELNGKIFYAGNNPALPPASQIKIATSGTVATVAGSSAVITGTGTVFKSLGIRRGDLVVIGDGASVSAGHGPVEYLQVSSVDSDTQITCQSHPDSAYTRSGMGFAICVGDGYHQGTGRADNGISELQACYAANNAGAGYRHHGLYGDGVSNCQGDANGCFASVISILGDVCLGMSYNKFYAENNGLGSIFCGSAGNVLVNQLISSDAPGVYLSSDGFNWGSYTRVTNGSGLGEIRPIGGDALMTIPVSVLAAGVLATGAISGRGYLHATDVGTGSLTMADNATKAWDARSGAEAFGYDDNSVAFNFDTPATIHQGTLSDGSGTRQTTKFAASFATNGARVFGVQFDGAIITPSTNSTAGGSITISKPSGRFRIASGQTTVTITNTLCYSTSHVFLSKQQLDATATDFKVVPGAGSFVVTLNAAATADVDFDFFLLT